LCDFIVRLAKNNPDLTSAVFLELAEKIEHERGNKYVSIIRGELANTELDEDEFYNGGETAYIDALDQWAGKAEQYLEEKKPHEAVLIAQAYMEHIGKHLSLEKMENYYGFFAGAFPEKALGLFRTALDQYAAENTGRTHYERIVEVFRKMEKIPGGAAVAADMKARYLVTYKNRRAMIEILTQKQAPSSLLHLWIFCA
jgi:hypothetical protein